MAVASHPFNDVGDRYDEAIDVLHSSNVVKGISANEFGVYQNIKRGDAAVILAGVLQLDTVNAPEAGFQDVNKRISGHVNALVQAGMIKGFSETEFAPDRYLTRGQMASILVNAYSLQEHMKQTSFTDLSKSFKTEIEALYGTGITGGVSAHEYGTNLNIKRGDFAVLLYKTMKFSEKAKVKSVSPMEPIRVIPGISLQELNLPQEAGVIYEDGKIGKKKVQWDTNGLNLNQPGEYVIEGKILGSPAKASVKVTVLSGLETKTLPEFYGKNLNDVTKLVIKDGSTGAQKTVTETTVIKEFLDRIKDIKFIPEKIQGDKIGWRYSITLFQDSTSTFQFEPTKVNGYHYYTEPDILPIVDNFYKNLELKGQDVSDITKLAEPDEIVYLHDGVKTVYPKEHPKFEKIIQLNKKRQTKQLEPLKLFVDYNDVVIHGDYLIYQYKSTNFVPVYFKLVPSPYERLENWVMNKYDSNIPADGKDNPSKINAYGHLAYADELLAYLEAK
jgi:hypothetical protein